MAQNRLSECALTSLGRPPAKPYLASRGSRIDNIQLLPKGYQRALNQANQAKKTIMTGEKRKAS